MPEPLTRLEQVGPLWAGHRSLFYSELVLLDFSESAGQEEKRIYKVRKIVTTLTDEQGSKEYFGIILRVKCCE